jgi:hypothetical protein
MRARVVLLVEVLGLAMGCGGPSTSVLSGPGKSDETGAGGKSGTIAVDGGSADGSRSDSAGGSGGEAGAPLDNPGFGGFPGGEMPSCSVIETQYANTVAGAQTCDVNGSGQCQQLASATLSTCPSCMVYVNSGLAQGIQLDWMDLGCASQPAQNCPPLNCPKLTGGTCVASSSGGTCSAQ